MTQNIKITNYFLINKINALYAYLKQMNKSLRKLIYGGSNNHDYANRNTKISSVETLVT